MKFEGKKILILGGNPETAPLVSTAKKMGLVTYVIDLVHDSPAKRVSDHAIDGNAADIDLLERVVIAHNIDGVLVGVADILVPTYEEVCRKFNMPCYANKNAIKVFCSKVEFYEECKRFNLNVIPNYTKSLLAEENIDSIEYPVIVKPIDSGGGVGMSVVNSFDELIVAIEKAKQSSRVGEFICEKYIKNGQDIQAYYTIIDGSYFLSSIVDRTTNKSQGLTSPVCIGASYNSKHIDLFKAAADQKFKDMFKSNDIQNGIMSLQCFVVDDRIYPYDPGFRLQGEGQHLMLKAVNGFDHREMLINFAMTGAMWDGDFSVVNDLYLGGKYACSVWVLLKKGVIHHITGLDKIKQMPSYKDMMQRFDIGDEILSSYVGTEKQVFARIYIASDSDRGLRKAVEFIHANLVVKNSLGENMIIDYFSLN
jgi:biotin carboxylase